jgi:hypothetical protein
MAANASSWNITPMPEAHDVVAADRPYPGADIERIRQGCVPEEMSEKWFIYWQDDVLHFHRSWTGLCVYQARFEPMADGMRMVELRMNRECRRSASSDARELAFVGYLIDVLLLDRDTPCPANDPDDPAAVLEAWASV